MFCQFPKTVPVHGMPTLQVDAGLLRPEQVIFLADGTRSIKCLSNVFVTQKVCLDDTSIALGAVNKVVLAALSANAAAITVVILFLFSVLVIDFALQTKIIGKYHPTLLTG